MDYCRFIFQFCRTYHHSSCSNISVCLKIWYTLPPQYLMVSHTLISLWLQVRGYKSLSDAYMLSVGMGQQYHPQWMGSIILAGGSRRSRGASSVCRVFVAKNGAGAGRARGSDWNKMLGFLKMDPPIPMAFKAFVMVQWLEDWSNDWMIWHPCFRKRQHVQVGVSRWRPSICPSATTPKKSCCEASGCAIAGAQMELSPLEVTSMDTDLLVLSREWMGTGEWDDYK